MNLHLLQCRPDPIALATWATHRKLLSPDGDYGYALHALLAAAFDEVVPTPFRYLDARRGLLAYTDQTEDAIRTAVACAPEGISKVLGLKQLRIRPFPTIWQMGKNFGFEVRVRPVIRAKDGRERDAYLHRLGQVKTGNENSIPESMPQREVIYLEWLNRQLQNNNAAQINYAAMEGFSLNRILRRTQKDANRKRRTHIITGPDALFKGEMEVTNTENFSRLLKRGIGRHRAFGYGMLLLKPAQRV